jgi:hypothetical protein
VLTKKEMNGLDIEPSLASNNTGENVKLLIYRRKFPWFSLHFDYWKRKVFSVIMGKGIARFYIASIVTEMSPKSPRGINQNGNFELPDGVDVDNYLDIIVDALSAEANVEIKIDGKKAYIQKTLSASTNHQQSDLTIINKEDNSGKLHYIFN